MSIKYYKLTQAERELTDRVGKRAASAVRNGATHLDAITTQMQASGIDPWDRGYMQIGRRALDRLIEEVPLWAGTPEKRSHTTGWTDFVAAGEPQGTAEDVECDEEAPEKALDGFQVRRARRAKP